jgi:hypothetical protein
MRVMINLIIFGWLLFDVTIASAQQCSQCSQIQSNGAYSCQSLSPDQRPNCERVAQEAAARCYRTCTNYNGIGPANPPQGNAVK